MRPVTSAFAILALLFAPATAMAQTSPSPSPSASSAPSLRATIPQVFHPPAGWVLHTVPMTMAAAHMIAVWISPTIKTTGSSINLVTQAFSGKTPDAFLAGNKASLEKLVGSQNLLAYRTQKLCNGTVDGTYIEDTFVFGTHTLMNEQAMVVGPTDAYIVTYSRIDGAPEDPVAHDSLLTLCLPASSPNADPSTTPSSAP